MSIVLPSFFELLPQPVEAYLIAFKMLQGRVQSRGAIFNSILNSSPSDTMPHPLSQLSVLFSIFLDTVYSHCIIFVICQKSVAHLANLWVYTLSLTIARSSGRNWFFFMYWLEYHSLQILDLGVSIIIQTFMFGVFLWLFFLFLPIVIFFATFMSIRLFLTCLSKGPVFVFFPPKWTHKKTLFVQRKQCHKRKRLKLG